MLGTIHNKYLFLFVIILFLIVVGMFIEGNAALIVLVPLLAPVAEAYGIDPIHFAMVYIHNGLRRRNATHGCPDICHLRHHQV